LKLTGVSNYKIRRVICKTYFEILTDITQVNLNAYRGAKEDNKSLMKQVNNA